MFSSWLRSPGRFPLRPARPRTVRPALERLEPRLALSLSAVPDTTAAPFRTVVEVESVIGGQAYTASGILLDGTHVLTAGHVLYENGTPASFALVYPGRNGESVTPFGSAHSSSLVVHPSYVSGPYAGTDAFDLGIITLDHDMSAAVGGGFSLLPMLPDSYFSGGTIDVLGYPGDTFSGVNQYFSTGPAQAADSTEISWSLRDVPIQHGSSGSPVYVKQGNTRVIVGIVSELSTDAGYATRLTPAKYNWIVSQLEAPPAGSFATPAPPAGAFGPGVFDPSTATWYLRNSNSPGSPDFPAFSYGVPGWKAVTGDWDGNGTTTVGVVNPSTMTWYLRNSNSPGAPDVTVQYGAPGDIPVTGDWNGAGVTTLGVFDPRTATFYLRNSNTPGAPDIVVQFGMPGWTPVVGDWDGDGTTTIGAVDPSTMTWYLKNANAPGAPDIAPFQYGVVGWEPVVGDWDGNGTTTPGLVDPTTMLWYLKNGNATGAPDYLPFSYGGPSWQPVAGSWLGFSGAPRKPVGRQTTALEAPAGLFDDGALLGVALAWHRAKDAAVAGGLAG